MKRLVLTMVVMAVLFALNGRAETVVNVETAGTLATLCAESDAELRVTGVLNGTDLKHLRRLVTEGGVTTIDMGGARIVSGGVNYYKTYKAENDVVGECLFTECTGLTAVVLPGGTTEIGANAFSRSGLKSIVIPDGVTRLGGDAFAYCEALQTVVIGSRVTRLDQGVFYSSAVKTAYVKPLSPPSTPAYLFSSSPKIMVYTESLADYRASSWKSYGNIAGGLEAIYPIEADPMVELVNARWAEWFSDVACTALKAECQAMTDEALTTAMAAEGMPPFMVALALKLKNAAWADYEQDFRIHSYGAYSDANYWNDKMMSSGGSYMGNPTGIMTATASDTLYVFVATDVPDDATLYIAGCAGNDLLTKAKTGQKLTKGLNIVVGQAGALYYIVYTADTQKQTRTLDEWPMMTIHIEGGQVNGYYDVSRHSDADYVALLKAAQHELFTIRGQHALFNFKTTTYRKVWPKTIDKSISWFDSLTVWQKELMGYCESVASGRRAAAPHCLTGGEAIYPIYYNNPNFAIEGKESDAGYANSTSYRTSYNSVECIRNSFDVSRADMDDWCAGHECGHNNQRAINLEGGTEVSNNLFANVVRYLDGLVTSVGSPLSVVMDEYAQGVPYFVRDVDSQLRMYYQLYLYYHQAGRNTSFYPDLFKALRDDPLTLWNTGTRSSLKFVRKVCEVAGEDLTDFFTAWGFFEPFTNMSIEDYGAHTFTVRQAEINRTLTEIQQYPKNRTLLFVEDRAQYVPTTDFLTTAGGKRRDSDKVGQCGELGQFTDYLPGACQPSSYTYLQVDSLYAMEGTGGVGFLMLDEEGKMCYAANALNFCIPTSVGTDFAIWSIDADGTLHETSRVEGGVEEVWLDRVGTLPDSLSLKAIKATISGPINGTDIKYLRKAVNEGNLVAIDLAETKVLTGGESYYDNNRSVTNGIGNSAFRNLGKLVAISLPQSITKIETNAFSGSGLKEAWIPNGVTTVGGDAFAYCKRLTKVVVGSKVRSMGQGVFYSSAVKHAYVFPTTPPSITSYLFSSNPVIHVHASALEAYKKSKWNEFGTLVGDLDDHEEITAVQQPTTDVEDDMEADEAPIYDALGRRVTHLQPGTLYFQRGHKFVTPCQ